ncbi:hypothetical protein HGA13_17140 [Nocardia speluncae]|uniref:TrbL/VirB6 plasmid conjugal transfer protein n=1 Tax=Nocardia speluncae TaxID=419477 RepID=A0A846XH36_9NOCA|nr:hypothetical protein [Nocardia speluncae]NKY34787.1 hypothetical protein [Nocardia speluncae]
MTTPTSPPAPAEAGVAARSRRKRSRRDPLQWYPDTLVKRFKKWLHERPWRRRLLWTMVIFFVLVVFPGIIGAVATAQVGSGVSQVDGLSWMNVKDSQGVPLATYIFASDKGSLLNPGNTILWTILGLEFTGYISIVTTAIWIIGFTFSFTWLDMFADALIGVADAFVAQVATPMVLITAVTIGAFFVAWFIVRGFPGKATMQVITMFGVAVLGPIFLAEPLHDVLSSDGLLSQGRNIGISVAAGLTGDGNPNPVTLVTDMQHDLADNFARKPIQVWNFGHVVDNYHSCESAWTSGVLSGTDDYVREAMEDCNNKAAVAKAANPTMGQVGTGLILLVCATLLLLFAVYLALKVTKAALDTIYHGFMAILGFAAGGFVYGPTQTYLVRNVVDSFVAAARMTAFTCFLGIYILFMSNLFEQAPGQVISVIVIACVVEIVAIAQIRRLSNSLDRGNNWVANRFALAIQGNQGSGGGGGGSALGMGVGAGGSGGGGSLSGLGMLAALSTVNNSPLTGWLMMATPGPLNPLARGKKASDLANIRSAAAREEYHDWTHQGRANWLMRAQARAAPYGGMNTPMGVAHSLDGLGDLKVPGNWMNAVLLAGGTDNVLVHQGMRSLAAMQSSMSGNPYGWGPLQKAVAAARAVENHMLPTDPIEARRAFASQAAMASANFLRHTPAPRAGAVVNHGFVNRVRQNWDSDIALRNAITPDQWNTVGRDTRWTIATEAAQGFDRAAQAFSRNPGDRAALRDLSRWQMRLANLDHLDPASGLDPWDS